MKVAVKDGKSCEKILKVEVAEDVIQKEYDEYYKSVASQAKIPGFRPGKAPRHVLEMHYGHDARESVLKHLISESYRQALQERSLEPLGMPQIQEIKFEAEKLSYEARIETRPKIKLGRVTGLSGKKETVEVKPQEVEEALKRVRESLAQFKAVEDRPAAVGDSVIADYVCLVEGKEFEKRNGDWLEIREDEFLKGFSVQLVGVKPGDEKEIQVTLPDNFGRKEFAGKAAVFKVKVKEIKAKTLPEINDDMAKEAGEFKTLAELREKVEKDLRAMKTKDAEARYEKSLLDELIKQNKIELPEALVQKRLDYLVEDTLEHSRRHHGDAPGGPPLEELKKTLRGELATEAGRQVHLAFLLDEIAVRENITAGDEDVKAKIRDVAASVRQPAEAVEKYYRENEEARETLVERIRTEKAIEFIKKNAKN